MGYEVLDTGGDDAGVGRLPDPRLPATDVYALDDLPPGVPDAPPGPRRRPRLPSSRWMVVIAVAALSAGVLAGARWSSGHAEQERASAQRSMLALTALSESYVQGTTDDGPVVDVVVRLFNAGPLGVDVIGATSGGPPGEGGANVHGLGLTGGLRVPASGQLAVSITRSVDCSSIETIPLTVPVRTADGATHWVDVQPGSGQRLVPQEICRRDSYYMEVTAELTGTLDRSAVLLRNPQEQAAKVYLDPRSPFTQSASRVVTLTASPRLPVTVPARSTRRLNITVEAPQCVQDLDIVQEATGFGQVSLIVEVGDASTAKGSRTYLGLDLTALVGAALQRACS